MGVDGVRLYHDQALYKEPGGGFTPWHQDQTYWPLDTTHTITMWMPLLDIPPNVGSMRFASGSHAFGNLGYRRHRRRFAALLRCVDRSSAVLP